MEKLPKLPGFQFPEHLQKSYHPVPHYFDYKNGYRFYKFDKNLKDTHQTSLKYDPMLTYGIIHAPDVQPFVPHFVTFDKKVLTFYGYFKEIIDPRNNFFHESGCRIRYVNIYYHLEDHTMSAVEPQIHNSGITQGKFLRRSKILKSGTACQNQFWHWKDFRLGMEIPLNGVPIKLIDCDAFTRNFLEGQGVSVGCSEQVPIDPYIGQRSDKLITNSNSKRKFDNKFLKLLEFNDQMLSFKVIWDENVGEQRRFFNLYYHLADNTISLKDCNPLPIGLKGSNSFPLFLKKQRLPKTIHPAFRIRFPSVYMEISDNEILEYYELEDFLVGNYINVFGRQLLIYDCNQFTRQFYIDHINIEQIPKLSEIKEFETAQEHVRQLPPANVPGAVEDSILNCVSINVEKRHENYIRKLYNSNKILRYGLQLKCLDRSDNQMRQFILNYRLSDGQIQINEILDDNKTVQKYLRYCYVMKPGSTNVSNPDYYTPNDFAIGSILEIFARKFQIISTDLYVFKYMEANRSKFDDNVFESVRNFMKNAALIQ